MDALLDSHCSVGLQQPPATGSTSPADALAEAIVLLKGPERTPSGSVHAPIVPLIAKL